MKSFKLIITSMVLLAISLAGAQVYGADTGATYLMEEGSGITTDSLPGNYYQAFLDGGVAWDASTPLPSSNWCLDFDGLDDFAWNVFFTTPSWSEISVEAWVKQDTIIDLPGIAMSNYTIEIYFAFVF